MLFFFYFQSGPSDHRRKWDRDHYESLAKERISEEIESLRSTRREREAPVKRDLLQPRDYTVSSFYDLLSYQYFITTVAFARTFFRV